MKQLAESLGVSRTTVSLVLQGKADKYRISKETQNRILKKVEELDFKPNYFASALNKGRTGTIGVIFPDVFEGFMSHMVRGIESNIYKNGLSMMLSTSRFDNNREKKIIKEMLYRGIDGLLIVHTAPFIGQSFDYSHLYQLHEKQLPYVMIDRYLPELPACLILQEDKRMAEKYVTGLIESGASEICCVSFHLDVSSVRDRISGYADTMKEAGKKEHYIFLEEQNPDARDLYLAIENLIKNNQIPDCFFVTTRGIAEKLAWVLKQKGISIEDDVTICCFGSSSQWLDSPFI